MTSSFYVLVWVKQKDKRTCLFYLMLFVDVSGEPGTELGDNKEANKEGVLQRLIGGPLPLTWFRMIFGILAIKSS
jgi:hypothetical protein